MLDGSNKVAGKTKAMKNQTTAAAVLGFLVSLYLPAAAPAQDDYDEAGSVEAQHAHDKMELEKIKDELGGVKSSMSNAMQAMGQVEAALQQRKDIKEFTFVAREGKWELCPGVSVACYLYNGQEPGPQIKVTEGDPVRIILRNELKVPTSLHFHGMILPQTVDGLPRANAGLIAPGETYVYQFIAGRPGTYWYHPQVIHADQQGKGLAGAIIVEPRSLPDAVDKDEVLIIGQWTANQHEPESSSKSGGSRSSTAPVPVTYFTVNGKSAPSIPALDVHKGQRVRLRVINAAQQVVPLHITGHRFRVISINGGDMQGSDLLRDSIALQPSDRVDLEFVADNPGVWSISSELASQTTNNGKFPGGIACVLRYSDFKP